MLKFLTDTATCIIIYEYQGRLIPCRDSNETDSSPDVEVEEDMSKETDSEQMEFLPKSEYDRVLPYLFPRGPDSFGEGCPVPKSRENTDTFPYHLPWEPCPSVVHIAYLVYRDDGSASVSVACTTQPKYTYDDHTVLSPIDYPLDKDAPRTFHNVPGWSNTKNVVIMPWPSDKPYIEIHCGQERAYFSRLIPDPKVHQRSLAHIALETPKIAAPNFYMIIIDTVSYSSFRHLFPATTAFLKTINGWPTHRMFSFTRYNTVDTALTITNMSPMFAGRRCPSISK